MNEPMMMLSHDENRIPRRLFAPAEAAGVPSLRAQAVRLSRLFGGRRAAALPEPAAPSAA